MTAYSGVVPTEGDPAQSYEYIFDIATIPVGAAEPVWVNVPDITALNPLFNDKVQSIVTYAHKGSSADSKTGSSFTLGFNILKIRDNTGEFQPEWLILKAAADAKGKANRILVRFYDALGASDAYEGTTRVSRDARPETGAEGVGFDAFTLNGVGEVLPIENPVGVVAP